MTLYEKLQSLSESDMLPLHMPGHKRSHIIETMSDIYDIDITEIDGFDDLHHPTGILADMADQAARLYGAKKAYLSVNGSSAANQAAIMATCKGSGSILIDRGCHKSVYYAIELGNLRPIYLKPKYDLFYRFGYPVEAEDVKEALRNNPDCKTVVITSPTYEGFIADIESIAEAVHAHGASLIVDCAHGAHLGFGEFSCENPINLGADLVVMSLHKMLPAPTQTALLLVGSRYADDGLLRHYMSVFQSSSPSYVLMAGIGECLKYMEEYGRQMYDTRMELIKNLRFELSELKYITVDGSSDCEDEVFDHDQFKLIICSRTSEISGKLIYDSLRNKYHIQCEMYAERYALAMLSLMDSTDTFARIRDALLKLDAEFAETAQKSRYSIDELDKPYVFSFPKMECIPGEALKRSSESCPINEEICGRISADYVMAYPPGIPIIVPGEVYSSEIIEIINKGLQNELNIIGISDDMKVRVLQNYGQNHMPDGQELNG